MTAHAAAAAAALALAGCAAGAAGAGVRASDAGTVTFSFGGDADAAWVAGTMTGWRRVPLERRGGRLEVALEVPPGRHEYRMEVEVGGVVRVAFPEHAERVDDGYGGENAVLRVGGR